MLKKEISLIPMAPTVLSPPLLQEKGSFVAERLFSKPPVNMLSSEPPAHLHGRVCTTATITEGTTGNELTFG